MRQIKLEKILLHILNKTKPLCGWAPVLVKITGKSQEAIHPKHLIKVEDLWFKSCLNKNMKILDIGSGNGQLTLKTSRHCKEIIGIEINKKQLKMAQNEQKRLKFFNVKFKKANAEKRLDFADSSFDAIIFLDVLEHLKNRRQILIECKRILKKEGRMFISVPNKETSWKKRLKKAGLFYYANPDHKIEYSISTITKELKKGGFAILDIRPIIYDTPFIGFIDLIGGLSLKLYTKITFWRISRVGKQPEESTGFRIVCKPI